MVKKNSIFQKILIPVVIVMLIQTLLISLVLIINGTIRSLEDSAVENMSKNADNRGITLENMMVHSWSNLDKLEGDISAGIDGYLEERGVSIGAVLASGAHETELLTRLSDSLINALRLNMSTGVYMYFIEDAVYIEEERVFRGLYYRDLDPFSTPADNSDIQYIRGFVDIARKDRIQLDSLWSEAFKFSPNEEATWRGFAEPLMAALNHPELDSVNVSYWNTPHFANASSTHDSNECVTYTRPLIYEGRVIGMLGVEMQVEQLKKYFPASDFDGDGKGGYMLIKYSASDAADGELSCEPYAVTGSYIGRLLGSVGEVTLTQSSRSGVYTIDKKDIEGLQIAVKPLRLYNVNAPFSDEQWAIASVGVDSMLFGPARGVSRGIFISTSLALVVGVVLLAILIRLSTRPLISIANQIAQSEQEDPIVVTNSNTYEIALLCSTLNTMRERRRHAEAELREERERYLFALESATDTFLEYDLKADSFMLYYFSTDKQRPTLHSNVTHSFLEKIRHGDICHEDEIEPMLRFFSARVSDPIEIRFRASLVTHIEGAEIDGEYYWFLFKASHILGEDGSVEKIIGIAREITGEKLAEQARIEAARRDLTTGLYNSEYGNRLVQKRVWAATSKAFAIIAIHVDNFETFETYYGRVFAGIVLMKLSRELSGMTSEHDIAVRSDNDDILLLLAGAGRRETEAFIRSLRARIELLYVGENADLRLTISTGAALSVTGADYAELRDSAITAARYAARRGGNQSVFFGEIPPEVKMEKSAYRENLAGVSLDISKEGMPSLAFDLFEHTSDIKSAINILLDVIGGTFALSQVIICLYDSDFDANRVEYQWCAAPDKWQKDSIEKIERGDFERLKEMLDENGSIQFTTDDITGFSDGVRRLLCVEHGEAVSAFGCAMYENGVHMGRALFKSDDINRQWLDSEEHCLYEITKIVAANICIDKSNSASRAKSEFLSRMSHEIRTPMNAIIGMTSIAKESMASPERVEDCLSKIDFSAKHLLALINDVLEMSRIESGKLSIGSAPFSLDVFADSVDTLMRPQIAGKGVSFVINRGYTHRNVIGDEYRLRQVLVNLIGNAGKFTESGGVITFSIEERDLQEDGCGYFKFSVRDTGVGISREDQPNIFRAFEQAKEGGSAKKNKEGTGLGLAISSNIIGAMGSKIELESEAGKGSEFFFTVKLELGEEPVLEEAAASAVRDSAESLAGKKILLVEDNDINIEIALYVLEDVGIVVDIARNGQEAVDKFLGSSVGYYDTILMDIQMPVMDGLTATRNIRKSVERPDSRTVPIIAMTANAFDEDMKKSIASGMDGHIPKPIDNERLYSLLRQLMPPQKAL